MRFPLLLIFILFFSVGFYSFEVKVETKLNPLDGFPIWLKDEDKHTDQTSGITFIKSKGEEKYFLICDDIGEIYHLKLKGKKVYLNKVKLSDKVQHKLKSFPKWDFEEIVYDKFTKKVYLSIEGNGLNYAEEAGIYELKFKKNAVLSDEIISIEKVNFPEWSNISKYFDQNIGFEGVAVSKNRLFLGLEGFTWGELFLDSTVIFIIDKNSNKLIREISTKGKNIQTICGLYAINDYHILGIDRNSKNLFEINFDKSYNYNSVKIYPLNLHVPKNSDLTYTAALESITLDDENYVFSVDDPWKKFYIPPADVLNKLNEKDAENFKDFIPLLYKFNLNLKR